MRILFFHPTTLSAEPEPCVGLGMLIAIAQQAGHQVEYYDHDLHHRLIALVDVLAEFQPDLFAASCMTPQFFAAQETVAKVKSMFPDCVTIMGGPHPSALPERTLKETPTLDFCCFGEGEVTFREFLTELDRGTKDFRGIAGLAYREKGQIAINCARPLLSSEELDELPMVAWDVLLRRGLYRQKVNYLSDPVPIFSVITARGCPYECTFCNEPSIWKRRVRTREIGKVVEEMQYLIGHYGAVHFNVLDDTFTLAKKRVAEFARLVKPLNIQYRVTGKVNTVSRELLQDLADSGCKLIAYGVESGDENVLAIMRKHQKLEGRRSVREAFELTQQAGITSFALCMVGNIGEDFEAVKRTAKYVESLPVDLTSVAIMTPYPGSENYRICRENGWILSEEWSKWCATPIHLREWEPVARTDKMDRRMMLKSYYYLNRRFLVSRLRKKYGRAYLLNFRFYRTEVINRIRTIGLRALARHGARLIGAEVARRSAKL